MTEREREIVIGEEHMYRHGRIDSVQPPLRSYFHPQLRLPYTLHSLTTATTTTTTTTATAMASVAGPSRIGPKIARLPHKSVLEVSGPDTRKFLNGQSCKNVEALGGGYSGFINASVRPRSTTHLIQ